MSILIFSFSTACLTDSGAMVLEKTRGSSLKAEGIVNYYMLPSITTISNMMSIEPHCRNKSVKIFVMLGFR